MHWPHQPQHQLDSPSSPQDTERAWSLSLRWPNDLRCQSLGTRLGFPAGPPCPSFSFFFFFYSHTCCIWNFPGSKGQTGVDLTMSGIRHKAWVPCWTPLSIFFFFFYSHTCCIWNFPGSKCQTGPAAASLCHSHSKVGSKPRLQTTSWLAATPDP